MAETRDGCHWNLLGSSVCQCLLSHPATYIVPEQAKVSQDYFIEYILRPTVDNDILRLYGDRAEDVVLHMDSAPAHTEKKPSHGWISQCEVDSERRLACEVVRHGPAGLWCERNFRNCSVGDVGLRLLDWRQLSRKWGKFTVASCRRVISSWKSRVMLMLERNGSHVKHVLDKKFDVNKKLLRFPWIVPVLLEHGVLTIWSFVSGRTLFED